MKKINNRRNYRLRDSETLGSLRDRVDGIEYKGKALYWADGEIILEMKPLEGDTEYLLSVGIDNSQNQLSIGVIIDGENFGFGNTRFTRHFIDWLYDNEYIKDNEKGEPSFTKKAEMLKGFWEI